MQWVERGITFKSFCLRLKEGSNSSSAKSTINYNTITAKLFAANSVHSLPPVLMFLFEHSITNKVRRCYLYYYICWVFVIVVVVVIVVEG